MYSDLVVSIIVFIEKMNHKSLIFYASVYITIMIVYDTH